MLGVMATGAKAAEVPGWRLGWQQICLSYPAAREHPAQTQVICS
jgi:hypothetical protein